MNRRPEHPPGCLPLRCADGNIVALMCADGLRLWSKRTRRWYTFSLDDLLVAHALCQLPAEKPTSERH